MKVSTTTAAIVLTLCAAGASAENWDDRVQIRGYGTLGVVHSDEDQADFVSMPLLQTDGAGHTDAWSTAVDSRVGLQIDVNLTERLSAVVQLVSEATSNNTWDGDPNPHFTPSLEWANLSYKVTDDLSVRAGRIVLPFLSYAEFRKVGFAQHWLRAPVEVYGMVPFTSSDGADVSYRLHTGDAINTLRAHYGYQSLRTEAVTGQTRSWGVNDSFERGALMLRAAYMRIHFEAAGPGFQPLVNTFALLAGTSPAGQNAGAIARALGRQFDPALGQDVRLYGVGASYDPSDWFVMGEVVREESHGIVGKDTAGYVSFGGRFGSWTPFATYARVKFDDRSGDYAVPLAGLPPPAVGLGGALNGIIRNFTDVDTSQQSLALGLRWDLHGNFALTAQFDHIALDDGSVGQLSNIQPGFRPGGNLNLLSVTLDYVF
jgi:hypothetical protein